MIPLTPDATKALSDYLGELERDLESADTDIRHIVAGERDTLRDILGRRHVTAADLSVLETLRDYAEEEADEIEREAGEDDLDLADLPEEDPTFKRYFVLLERLRICGGYLTIFGLTHAPGEA
jgi:hemerythrin-like domain-containing protein